VQFDGNRVPDEHVIVGTSPDPKFLYTPTGPPRGNGKVITGRRPMEDGTSAVMRARRFLGVGAPSITNCRQDTPEKSPDMSGKFFSGAGEGDAEECRLRECVHLLLRFEDDFSR
jgi:hypothetical protein